MKITDANLDEFRNALKSAHLTITRVDPSKSRSVTMSTGGTIAFVKFGEKLIEYLGEDAADYPFTFRAAKNESKILELVCEYARKEEIIVGDIANIEIPSEYEDLTLNLNHAAKSKDEAYFMTTSDEYISPISGWAYLEVTRMKPVIAASEARKVFVQYLPRQKRGIIDSKDTNGNPIQIFNSYVPPKWKEYEGDLPDRLPKLVERLIHHLIPDEYEREYFYAWVKASLTTRAMVYLVLCGAPGTGKNRLKLIVRALHGSLNTVDGKKSTFSERFNSQLDSSTLTWFDELHYNADMINSMKELQNDTIAIEKKGVDATRSTPVFTSTVITNNYPRQNYFQFDDRKFAALQITPKRLDTAFTSEEIDMMTNKFENPTHPDYDLKMIAQTARWIIKHGKPKKWTHLEYKGPMFYHLAHTSMSRWQKRVAQVILIASEKESERIRYTFDKKLGFLWSSVSAKIERSKNSIMLADFSTVQHFFDVFLDAEGKKTFKTMIVKDDITNDFWVKLINQSPVLSAGSGVQLEKGEKDDAEKENEEEDYTDVL